MNLERLCHSVNHIPHLKLPIEFNAQQLQSEFVKIPPQYFQPYRSSVPVMASYVASIWHGVSLFSTDGSTHGDLTENPKQTFEGPCKPTAVADICPYMASVAQDLGGQDIQNNAGTRCRLMLVQPRGQLTWHSHQFDGVENFKPWMIVCHVPIFAPKDFRYSVISIKEFRMGDHERTPMTVHTANYPAGEAWIFNSFHMHNIFSDTDREIRASLMFSLNLKNPKTYELVDRAVSEYKGPFVSVE